MPDIEVTLKFANTDEMVRYFDERLATTSEEPVVASEEPVVASEEPDARSYEGLVDDEGMPFDPEIHNSPETKNADGTWRAKKGKKAEETAARAAFKARGGNVEPPVSLPESEATRSALPGMELPPPMPEPITMQKMTDKITDMLNRKIILPEQMSAIYVRFGGTKAYEILSQNETVRAELYAELERIESGTKA